MSAEPRTTDQIVQIARCPQHGLHGERAECFVCGGEVEQVEMAPATWLGLLAILDAYYPAGVFTGASGDVGVRLVVLARQRAAAELALESARAVEAAAREVLGDWRTLDGSENTGAVWYRVSKEAMDRLGAVLPKCSKSGT